MNAYRDEDGTWLVIADDGHVVASGFPDEQAAWEWMDIQPEAE